MRTSMELEERVLALREQHPAWGGRKIAARLRALGLQPLAPSTVTDILRRNGALYTFGRAPVQYAWQLRARSPERAVADGLQG
jgi:hypothetical protein